MNKLQLDIFIPTGGIGKRLRPLTYFYPKPILPMMGKPLISQAIESCLQHCQSIFVSTFYKEKIVKNHLSSENYFSKLVFLEDKGLINIGGSLLKHRSKIFKSTSHSKDLLVVPSDHVLKNFPIHDIYKFHKKHHADITLILAPHKDYGDYVVINNDMQVTKITKQSSNDTLPSYTGICLFKKSFLKKILLNIKKPSFDLTKIVIIPEINTSRVCGYRLPSSSYWDDAGTWFRYVKNNLKYFE